MMQGITGSANNSTTTGSGSGTNVVGTATTSTSSTEHATTKTTTTRERKRVGTTSSGYNTDSSETEHLLSSTGNNNNNNSNSTTTSTIPTSTSSSSNDATATSISMGRYHPRRSNNVLSYYIQTYCTSMNSIKFIVLIVLSLQNSLFTVLRRYSQGIQKEMYSKYEVLMVGEIIKLVFSSYMIHRTITTKMGDTTSSSNLDKSNNTLSLSNSDDIGGTTTTTFTSTNLRNLSHRLIYLTYHSSKMIGLALIYGIMNVLSFVALRNIGAGTFTIFAQCKILTTAAFSAVLLQRHYSVTKWRALLSLVFGVLLFSEPIWNTSSSSSSETNNDNNSSTDNRMVTVGIIAVIVEVTLSGFASIYFEKVIKLDPLPLSIWERNFQLALGSIPVYIAFIISDGGGKVGYFGGWSILAWIVTLLGAAGGLLVALSIKYGDAILKTLATTAAIILSSVLDYSFLNGPLTPVMMIAAVQVIIAICNYTFDSTPEGTSSSSSSSSSSSTNNNITNTNHDVIKEKLSMDVELATSTSTTSSSMSPLLSKTDR